MVSARFWAGGAMYSFSAAVATETSRPKTTMGRTSRRKPTPPACMATSSLSPLNRPKTMRMAISVASGKVSTMNPGSERTKISPAVQRLRPRVMTSLVSSKRTLVETKTSTKATTPAENGPAIWRSR